LTWKRRFDDDGFVLAEEELGSAITEGWLDPSGFNKRDTSGLSAMRSEHEGPYAAIGFKSLYQKYYRIRKDWMGDIKPRHISICAHPRNKITCLQFDTEKILVGSDDAYIDVYDIKTGALRKRLEGQEYGVWVLGLYRNTLVSSSTDDTVRVWDIEKGVCTQVFKGHAMTRCLKILMPVRVGMMPDVPEVPLIITGSRDTNVRVWKLPLSGDKPFFPIGPSQNESECPYFVRTLPGHHDTVRAIAAHADTLVSGSYDCTVRVWKTYTGEAVHCLEGHTQKVYSVVLDHKRNRCISGSMDNLVKIWSLETEGLLFNLEGHTDLVDLLDLSHDCLVSAADSTLKIWNPENGQCRVTLSAHTGDVTCFQHDDQKVVIGSDHTLKMWNVQSGEFIKDLLTDFTDIWQVKFDEGRCIAAVKRDQFTHIEVSNLSEPVIVLTDPKVFDFGASGR
jgi:F-box and WD-40 domain protein CDC4